MPEGKTARDGGFSFVEQGCESKRPGSETTTVTAAYELHRMRVNNARVPAGQTVLGVAFFGYFFLLQKKSNSPTGETRCKKIEHHPNHAQNKTVPTSQTASK